MTHQELLQNMLSGWETYYHQIMNGDFSESSLQIYKTVV